MRTKIICFFVSTFLFLVLSSALIITSGKVKYARNDNVSEIPKWEGFKEKKYPIYWNFLDETYIKTLPKPEVVPTTKFEFFKPYKEATEKYSRNVKLGPNNELLGYTAGLPFPEKIDVSDPKAAIKIAWNAEKGYSGDDLLQKVVFYFVNEKGLTTRTLTVMRKRLKFTGRISISPVPDYDFAVKKKWGHGETGEVIAPADMRGTVLAAIKYDFTDRLIPADGVTDESWAYLPAIRRVRRLAPGEREDPVFGSTLIADDVIGGHISSMRSIKIVGETEIWISPLDETDFDALPVHSTYKMIALPKRIEKRPVWIIEGIHKNPKHVYGKMLMYIDKESYLSLYGENFDKKRDIWKRVWPALGRDKAGVLKELNYFCIDLQSNRATYFEMVSKTNVGLKLDDVSIDRLKERKH